MHTVSGVLKKAPFSRDNGDRGFMFIVELSEMIKDLKTGEKSYSNYKAFLFAKSPAHIQYYQSVLVEGAFLVLACEKLKIEVFNPESGGQQRITLVMDNAKLENAHAPQRPQQQQQGFNQPQQQRPPQQKAFAPKQQQQQQQQQPQQPQQPQQQPQQWGDSGNWADS